MAKPRPGAGTFTRRSLRGVLALFALGSWASACGPQVDLQLEYGGNVAKPLEAFCTAQVNGVGSRDVETDYLPHVVQCENGGAPFESLKAQAVSARSYLYYKLSRYGSIADGQSDQVYSCGATPSDEQRRAVAETAGQYLTYSNSIVCAFYVAGAHQSPPSCQGNSSDSTNTERYVTYNWGLSGGGIDQSTLGWVNSGNHANRGCMSQWGSRCLADSGWGYQDILRFYYGMDIGMETATGSCVTPPEPVNQPPRGYLDGASCDGIRGWAQDPDDADAPIDVHLYFDGPAGDPGATSLAVTADVHREDLCGAVGSCAHGFVVEPPSWLIDGQDHAVYAYGIDSEGGQNPLLGNAPRTLHCDPPEPDAGPDPYDASIGPVIDASQGQDASVGPVVDAGGEPEADAGGEPEADAGDDDADLPGEVDAGPGPDADDGTSGGGAGGDEKQQTAFEQVELNQGFACRATSGDGRWAAGMILLMTCWSRRRSRRRC